MLKLKPQYFGDLIQTANSLEKCPVLGRIEGRRSRECQRMRWLADINDVMHMKLNTLWEREAWCTAAHGVSESDMTGQLNNNMYIYY